MHLELKRRTFSTYQMHQNEQAPTLFLSFLKYRVVLYFGALSQAFIQQRLNWKSEISEATGQRREYKGEGNDRNK